MPHTLDTRQTWPAPGERYGPGTHFMNRPKLGDTLPGPRCEHPALVLALELKRIDGMLAAMSALNADMPADALERLRAFRAGLVEST